MRNKSDKFFFSMKYGYTFWHVWEIWTSKVKCAHFLLMTDSHNDIIICFLSLLIFHLIHLHVQTWFSFAISHFTGLLCLFIYIWKTINKAYILFWGKSFLVFAHNKMHISHEIEPRRAIVMLFIWLIMSTRF